MADEGNAAVYVGWTTFFNALNHLAEGIPAVVDRSVFQGLSGGVQGQLLAGLKFLGLTTDAGVPTSDLQELATTDEEARKAALARILRQRYSGIVSLDLTKATLSQLYENMASQYKVNGDTREKAVRFFLAAAKYAGLPLGRFLLQARSSASAPAKKRRPNGRQRDEEEADDSDDVGDDSTVTQSAGMSRTVELKSGGTLTVSASMDIFKLSSDDRNFVFGLIDMLAHYEVQSMPKGLL